ncbi:MAG: 6-phosphofructokinase [Puniceicoccales bacterium]|jgi:6-phosphofructokinase 1|nr:6-phosphofructokinase [Puniceicoccales bacterium]
MTGNLLIMQSGIASVVGNATLYGILSEALNYESIEEVYGVYGGFVGLQKGHFLDLAALSQQTAKMLLSTAGVSMQSESMTFDFTHCDVSQMIQQLQSKEIRYVGCICDQGALNHMHCLIEAAQSVHYDLHVIAIPQSNVNELPLADHSLGYGSYLKCLNAHVSEFNHWLRTSGTRIGIYEVSGGTHGWVAAGVALNTALFKWKQGIHTDNPFLVCLPEQPLNESLCIELIKEKIDACGYVCMVANHQLVNDQGEFLDLSTYSGSTAHYLSTLVQDKLGVPTQINSCQLQMQALSHFISKQDQTEAIACGRSAVQQLMRADANGKAAVVLRQDCDHYDFEVDFVDWNKLTTGLKFFPTDWTDNAMWVHYPFVKYALPLIQGEVEVAYEKGLARLVHL